MAKANQAWKEGDECWRGYARIYHASDKPLWSPEIRPATITEIRDGRCRIMMRGVMPGAEGKRTPGAWVAWDYDPANLHRTPETALRMAKRVAADANAEEAAKAA